ncbi:hypothetical protein [Lacticaseibacillus zhaodongensis]|uniref:hypothetical protein n=1 Tax=Lacticaseibacillus zhaodongensis TaxID=2668065 RepID=UPI0012D2C566|nr:hypothetical protein [Lacticaseibacillus zhaodongensis]
MVEVTAALVVITMLMLMGLHFGKRYVQEQRELAFMHQVQTEWRAVQSRAQLQARPGKMQWLEDEHRVKFMLNEGSGNNLYALPLPATLHVHNFVIEQPAGSKMYSKPRTVHVRSSLGDDYILKFEMGWGQLFIQRGSVRVE